MKIADSSVFHQANHLFQQEHTVEERLVTWIGDERPEDELSSSGTDIEVDLSPQAFRRFQQKSIAPVEEVETKNMDDKDPKTRIMREVLERLTGRKIGVNILNQQDGTSAPSAPSAPYDLNSAQEEVAVEKVGWGLEYDFTEIFHEQESLGYEAVGSVKTEDGRQIKFSLSLQMNREFYQSTESHLRLGDGKMIDPLVINFSGKAAELTDSTFFFDLDGDGSPEEISSLAQGSGFLAFDKNGNGVIESGHELFGPQSGNGFADLARYDNDENGWLDENDPIYEKLQVWARDQVGNDHLRSLAELDIGAIYLDGALGSFNLTNQANGLLGQVKETSFFMRENGTTGTIQELDLVV